MPGRDGTGPRGRGPRTGWGRGFCPPVSDIDEEALIDAQPRRGLGRGLGSRRGFGRGRGLGRRFRGGRP